MGFGVGSGFRLLKCCGGPGWLSVSLLGLVVGCGGGDGKGLFGGNDEDDAGDASVAADATVTSDADPADASSENPAMDGAVTSSESVPDSATSGATSGETSDGDGGSQNTTSDSAVDTTGDSGSTASSASSTGASSSGNSTTSNSSASGSTSSVGSDSTSGTGANSSGSDSSSSDSPELPSCVITSPSKALLNGVLAPEGDRVSASGDYAIRVEVTTSQPDGSAVLLSVSDQAAVDTTVQAGLAVFELVTLPEAATSTLRATCQGAMSVQSSVVTVEVDTVPPSVDESAIQPEDGQPLLPIDDQEPDVPGTSFDVCVPVTSTDALDVGVDNVCVTLGAQRTCSEATTGGAGSVNGACVRVVCEGDDAFDLEISVTDLAGNPSSHAVEGVVCAGTNLRVEVVDRRQTSFELEWTRASTPVSAYEVAYLEVDSDDAEPIDAESFDDATGIDVVDGDTVNLLLKDLTIEQRYHFAVRPIYEDTEREATVFATSSPLRARFETQVLTAPPNSEGTQWGFSVDASADLNADGASDLIVGQSTGDRVTIYFGHLDGAFSTQPDVTINGLEGSRFGVSVAVVGAVRADAIEYVAIAATDFEGNGRVYLLPSTAFVESVIDLTAGDNPYGPVVDFPAGPAAPLHVARLGDFDGDSVDDFAIHAPAQGQTGVCDFETNCEGALVVIRGGNTLPDTVNAPADTTWSFTFFPSDYEFGFYGLDWLLGVTNLVDGRSGVLATEWQLGVSRLISYEDSTPDRYFAQTLSAGEPEFDEDGQTVFDSELGLYPHVLTGQSHVAVQMTAGRAGQGVGVVELYTLDATNTFAAQPLLSLTALGDNNNAGQLLIGSRFSGRAFDYGPPLFGDQTGAPLVMGGRYYEHNLPILYMLKGETLDALPTDRGEVDVVQVADVAFDLRTVAGISAGWANGPSTPRVTTDWHGGLGIGIRDVNGDGYMDLGVVEWAADDDYAGGIVVLY